MRDGTKRVLNATLQGKGRFMAEYRGKVVVITGGSRGIGLAIAERYAKGGAHVAILTKDGDKEMQEAKRRVEGSFVMEVDVRNEAAMEAAIYRTVERFEGIDILVNNTSAACFRNTLETTPEEFDLMISTSVRAAFFLSQIVHPYLVKRENPHIVNISPPLFIDAKGFKDYLGFAIGKHAMSFCTLGMAAEFREMGIAVNSLWPKSTIATPTIEEHFVSKIYKSSRWPTIMADAAYALTQRNSKECTGHFFLDEDLLRDIGVEDFSEYAVDAAVPLTQSLFIPRQEEMKVISEDQFL